MGGDESGDSRLKDYGGGRPRVNDESRALAGGDGADPGTDPQVELAVAIRLGMDFEQFVRTPVGEALMSQAHQEVSENIAALLEMDDLTTPEAKTAHFRARVADKTAQWIKQFITDGRDAASAATD